MSATTEVIDELRRVMAERDEARERLAGLPAWQHACEQSRFDLAEAEAVIARRDTQLDDAREELAGLRAALATVTLERDEARRERNTWQRASEHRSDEIETLEEKLHAETLTRIAVARAWREAVAEVAEVLARTAAEKRCSP